MADVTIRDVDEDVLDRLRRRAAERGEPLERTLRGILAGAAQASREERLAELRRIRALSPPIPRGAPRAEDLVREDRDRE